MTKLEEAEKWLRGVAINFYDENAQEVAKELARLRAEVEELRGESHVIRYVQAEDPHLALEDTFDGLSFERRVDAEHTAGAPVYEVRISARKDR